MSRDGFSIVWANIFLMRTCLLAAAVFLSACAPKVVSVPVVTDIKFPDFARPIVPPAMAGLPAAASTARGWSLLQAGDLRNAEREFATAIKASPAFYPAETSLGYVELARKDARPPCRTSTARSNWIRSTATCRRYWARGSR